MTFWAIATGGVQFIEPHETTQMAPVLQMSFRRYPSSKDSEHQTHIHQVDTYKLDR